MPDADVLDIRADEDFEAVNEEFYRRRMTDGLPIIPPTAARVERMLGGTRQAPGKVLGAMGPLFGEATVEKVAVNAVMAGCAPEYLPVVLAAIEAMTDPAFNLYAINTTTHPCNPMIVVNGPLRETLRINGGYNCMGGGWRANATIGRAVRLCMINIGGGIAGEGDRATHGTPAKLSFCLAENEEASPYEPLHVRRGFKAGQSTVTVHGSEAPHEVNNHTSTDALGVLKTLASTVATLGSNNSYLNTGEMAVCLGPEHAHTIARDGFTVEDLQEYLFVHARNRGSDLVAIGRGGNKSTKPFMENDPHALVPVVMRAEDFLVFVAGGAGKHSMIMPSFGYTRSVTRAIEG